MGTGAFGAFGVGEDRNKAGTVNWSLEGPVITGRDGFTSAIMSVTGTGRELPALSVDIEVEMNATIPVGMLGAEGLAKTLVKGLPSTSVPTEVKTGGTTRGGKAVGGADMMGNAGGMVRRLVNGTPRESVPDEGITMGAVIKGLRVGAAVGGIVTGLVNGLPEASTPVDNEIMGVADGIVPGTMPTGVTTVEPALLTEVEKTTVPRADSGVEEPGGTITAVTAGVPDVPGSETRTTGGTNGVILGLPPVGTTPDEAPRLEVAKLGKLGKMVTGTTIGSPEGPGLVVRTTRGTDGSMVGVIGRLGLITLLGSEMIGVLVTEMTKTSPEGPEIVEISTEALDEEIIGEGLILGTTTVGGSDPSTGTIEDGVEEMGKIDDGMSLDEKMAGESDVGAVVVGIGITDETLLLDTDSGAIGGGEGVVEIDTSGGTVLRTGVVIFTNGGIVIFGGVETGKSDVVFEMMGGIDGVIGILEFGGVTGTMVTDTSGGALIVVLRHWFCLVPHLHSRVWAHVSKDSKLVSILHVQPFASGSTGQSQGS